MSFFHTYFLKIFLVLIFTVKVQLKHITSQVLSPRLVKRIPLRTVLQCLAQSSWGNLTLLMLCNCPWLWAMSFLDIVNVPSSGHVLIYLVMHIYSHNLTFKSNRTYCIRHLDIFGLEIIRKKSSQIIRNDFFLNNIFLNM